MHQDSDEDNSGFTFPACNPIKRIDYILVRNNTLVDHTAENVHSAIIKGTQITGQKPTADTGTVLLSSFGFC